MEVWNTTFAPLLRHALQAGAGSLVTAGILDGDIAVTAVGAVVGALTVGYWFIFVRPKTLKALAKA